MYVDSKKLEGVFRKIKQIQEHKDIYCLSRDHIPISIEDLKFVISDMYQLKIGIQEVLFPGSFLRSVVERYNTNHALIYVKHDLPHEMKRFAVAKELMHLAIDEPEDWSIDGVETVSSYLMEMALSTKNDELAENGAQSEMLAELAAMEMLYPYQLRQLDREKMIDQPSVVSKLALEFEIPRFIVARAISKNYSEIADDMWNIVGQLG
jgi:hypothetical protein